MVIFCKQCQEYVQAEISVKNATVKTTLACGHTIKTGEQNNMKTETFSTEVREAVANSSSNYCQYQNCCEQGTDHHHRKHNTKTNRKLYPMFLQSVFNAVLLCHKCHMENPFYMPINDRTAEMFETYLQTLTYEAGKAK